MMHFGGSDHPKDIENPRWSADLGEEEDESKSILIKLLTESEKTTIKQDYKSENENIVKNDIDIEPKVNNDVASENRKKWLEMINKTNI